LPKEHSPRTPPSTKNCCKPPRTSPRIPLRQRRPNDVSAAIFFTHHPFTIKRLLLALAGFASLHAADTYTENPGKQGDGAFEVGPEYKLDPDLTDKGNAKGKTLEPDKKKVRLSHADFVKRSVGTLPSAAWVSSATKNDGYLTAINSYTFYQNQLPAPPEIQCVVKEQFC
jgi:hypothetical protein